MKTLVATADDENELAAERERIVQALEEWRNREMTKFTRMIEDNS